MTPPISYCIPQASLAARTSWAVLAAVRLSQPLLATFSAVKMFVFPLRLSYGANTDIVHSCSNMVPVLDTVYKKTLRHFLLQQRVSAREVWTCEQCCRPQASG